MKVYFIIVAIAAVSAAGIADDNFGTYLAGENFNYFILKLSSANIYPLYSQSLFSTCF